MALKNSYIFFFSPTVFYYCITYVYWQYVPQQRFVTLYFTVSLQRLHATYPKPNLILSITL